MKKALIIYGGWEGHQPKEVSDLLSTLLQEESFSVTLSDTLDRLKQGDLESFDLIIVNWTMGEIASDQLQPLLHAIESGVGLAGCHGGLGDSFRGSPDYQHMVGGQWVSHPGGDGVSYTVNIRAKDHPIVQGMTDFPVCSEQYYMHIDPAIQVLATTNFGEVEMPVVWTKTFGAGKVFYCSLGHQANIVAMPETSTIMRRGMVWAAR